MNYGILDLAGVSQGQFAEVLGVSRITVNTWVNGRNAPKPRLQRRVREFLMLLEQAVHNGTLPVQIPDRKQATDAALAPIRQQLDAGN